MTGGQDIFQPTGFFRVEEALGRSWLVDPFGHKFLSVGMNHADETNLKYPHNPQIYRSRCGSHDLWIRDGVVKDLCDWGFSTIGWTADHISGKWGASVDWNVPVNMGHSLTWSARDFVTADMPYCVDLRVAEIEGWNGHPRFRDVWSEDFESLCDYLSRSVVAEHADSANLVRYFVIDIPSWQPHATRGDLEVLRGLDARSREVKLYDVASRYYETIFRHIRRYHRHHVVLGDRCNGNSGIPTSVLSAMRAHVDALSVQYFTDSTPAGRSRMRDDLSRWQAQCGKPVLVADIGNWTPTELNPQRKSHLNDHAGRGADYVAVDALVTEPWLIGWHWCAYQENLVRGYGAKDPWDEAYSDLVDKVRDSNLTALSRL